MRVQAWHGFRAALRSPAHRPQARLLRNHLRPARRLPVQPHLARLPRARLHLAHLRPAHHLRAQPRRARLPRARLHLAHLRPAHHLSACLHQAHLRPARPPRLRLLLVHRRCVPPRLALVHPHRFGCCPVLHLVHHPRRLRAPARLPLLEPHWAHRPHAHSPARQRAAHGAQSQPSACCPNPHRSPRDDPPPDPRQSQSRSRPGALSRGRHQNPVRLSAYMFDEHVGTGAADSAARVSSAGSDVLIWYSVS